MIAKFLVCVVASALAGCSAAAWPAIHRTTTGVESSLTATPDEAEARARTALAERDLEITRYTVTPDGARRVLDGENHDLRVTIEIDRESATATRTEVKAWRSVVRWDRGFARALLDRIIVLG
jgi:hypothetical protein